MNFYMPVRLFTGPDCLSQNADLIASYGRKCLIVTSGSAAKRSGALDDVIRILDAHGIAYTIYSGIQPNPTITSCIEGGRVGNAFGAEFVIGIGGGSPLDASKVVAVSVSNPAYEAADLYSLKWENKPVPVILVGTTSGTGSEVTQISVITNLNGNKVGMRSDDLYASLAFGDPKYTDSMPLSVTATTGVDALCHCLESYLNKAANDISRGIAVKGILQMLPILEKIAKGILPNEAERETMYNGSILGGMAICITGTVAPHAIGYLLSESYDVPHGFACACFIPALLAHTEQADPKLLADLFSAIGVSKESLLALFDALLPKYDFYLSDEEIEACSARWTLANRNIAKTPGTCDQKAVIAFLKSVFQKNA